MNRQGPAYNSFRKNYTLSSKNREYLKGTSISGALIWKIKVIFAMNGNKSETSRICQVDWKTVHKYVPKQNSTIKGRPIDMTPKKNEYIKAVIIELCDSNNSVYMYEISNELNATFDFNPPITSSTVHKMVNEMGYTRKKVVMKAVYRRLARIQFSRFFFRLYVTGFHPLGFRIAPPIHPHRFYICDEVNFNQTDTCRKYGYSLKGEPANTVIHQLRQQSYSSLVLINFSRVVLVHTYPTTGQAVGTDQFLNFLRAALVLIPRGFIFLMDNAPSHTSNLSMAAINTARDEGNIISFLSPYSPDYSAIELLFNYLKISMKKRHNLIETVPECVERILNNCPEEKMNGYYRKMQRKWYSNEL